MSAKVVSLQSHRQSVTLIAIMSGKLDDTGELTEITEVKLTRAIDAADNFRRQNPPRPYVYVFPDCSRHEDGGQRVCDVLRLCALTADPYCSTVMVPPADAELLTYKQHLVFFNEVKANVVGDCVVLL